MLVQRSLLGAAAQWGSKQLLIPAIVGRKGQLCADLRPLTSTGLYLYPERALTYYVMIVRTHWLAESALCEYRS